MYNTTNTRLAAALKALGHDLATIGTCSQGTIFQFEALPIGTASGEDYEKLWRDKTWLRENFEHPFSAIVRVADARDWIVNKVIHGRYQETGNEDTCYFIHDINVAACVIAAGYYLICFKDRKFYFVAGARDIHMAYKSPALDTPIYWQERYLTNLKALMGLVPRQKNCLDNTVLHA